MCMCKGVVGGSSPFPSPPPATNAAGAFVDRLRRLGVPEEMIPWAPMKPIGRADVAASATRVSQPHWPTLLASEAPSPIRGPDRLVPDDTGRAEGGAGSAVWSFSPRRRLPLACRVLFPARQLAVETVVMQQENGSMAQRVQAEFLSELCRRIELACPERPQGAL